MQNHATTRAYRRILGFVILGASTLILNISPGYAQAGYGVSPIVQATPSMAATPAAPRISGKRPSSKVPARDIAYDSTMASNSQPVVIQGSPSTQGGVVEGFADQVPLSVALQQVLPQGMGFTLSDGVNPGQLVSWRGGRPWSNVLQDMLASSGLSYSATGNSVNITSLYGAPTVVAGNYPMPQQQAVMIPANGPSGYTYPALPPLPDAPPPYQPGATYGAPAAMPPQAMMAPAAPLPQATMPEALPPVMPMQAAPQPMPQMGAPPAATQQMASAGGQPLQIQNPALFQPQSWEAKPGQTLRTTLLEWCSRVGTELNWQAEYDYPIMATLNMSGTFEEATRTLLAGFNTAKPVPYGRLHYNPAAGQSILIVEANGNHYGD